MKLETLIVILLFFVYQYTSDVKGYNQYVAASEALLLGMVLYWLQKRPERIPSDPPSNTVQIAFYIGSKHPLIAYFPTLFSYKAKGVAVIINDEVMLPTDRGIEKRKRSGLSYRKWVIVDTRVRPSELAIQQFNRLEGKDVSFAGCLRAITPFLEVLGEDYVPLALSPAGYMEQLLSI